MLFWDSKTSVFKKNLLPAAVATFFSLFIMSIQPSFLARLVPTVELGDYLFIMGWINLCVMIAPIGLNILLLKLCSIYISRRDFKQLKGVIYFSSLTTLLVSLFIIIVLYLSIKYFFFDSAPFIRNSFIIGLAIVPCMSLVTNFSFVAQSLQRTSIALFLRGPLQVTMLLCTVLFYSYFYDATFRSSQLVFLYLLISLFSLAISVFIIIKILKLAQSGNEKPVFFPLKWLKEATPFLVSTTCFYVISQTDILMIGMLVGTEKVVVYSVGARIAWFATVGKMVMNAIFPSVYSELYSQNNFPLLQRFVSFHFLISVISFFAIGLLIVMGFCLYMPSLDPNYRSAFFVMLILLVGYMVDMFTGPCGFMLTMTGNQKIASKILLVMCLLNILLNAILIPFLKIYGAALATSITLCLINLTLMRLAYKKTSIMTGAIFWRAIPLVGRSRYAEIAPPP